MSSVAELTAAVGNSAVDKILVAAGTYDFTSDMCTESTMLGSAICIDRALTIEAQVPGSVVPGSVVLDAKGGRRVFYIQSGGTAELIGLDITGGSATYVRSPFELALKYHPAPQWKLTLLPQLAGWGTRHLGHGDADKHQRILKSGQFGALAF